jgi:glycosyltransferase involved in cell wall biosynthesis
LGLASDILSDLSVEGISIIICCYNSSRRIEKTLDHINRQLFDTSALEVILVDNASTDNTAEVALEKWALMKSKIPLHLSLEEKQGLRYARENGFRKAKYDLVLFVDDDNWLQENYVKLAYEIMSANPKVAMLGGEGFAVADIDLPDWFSAVKSIYAVGPQAVSNGRMPKNRGYLYGAGMVIRKKYLQSILSSNFPFATTDRKGNSLSGGHDVEMSMVFRLAGYEVWFSNELKFKHYIETHRISWEYAKKLAIGSSKNFVPFSFYVVMNYGSVSMMEFIWLLTKRIISGTKDSVINFLMNERSDKVSSIEATTAWTSSMYLMTHFFSAAVYFAGLKKFISTRR